MPDKLSAADQATYDRLQRKRIRLSQIQVEAQKLQSAEAAWSEFQDYLREQYTLKDGDGVRDTGEIVRAPDGSNT